MKNLYLSDGQYTIRWHSVHDFKIGEKVFLKSNPDWPMEVCDIQDNKVLTCWNDIYGHKQCCDFPPECMLQYKFAGLITFKKKYQICLN
jgi:hypothetical protein